MPVKWRIYYGDGLTYSSEDGLINGSYPFNVQAVVQADEDVGRQILNGFDWYIYKSGRWYGILDIPSLLDQAVHDLEQITIIRMGRMIPSKQYQGIMRRAREDGDFPEKSAVSRIEKPHGSKD